MKWICTEAWIEANFRSDFALLNFAIARTVASSSFALTMPKARSIAAPNPRPDSGVRQPNSGRMSAYRAKLTVAKGALGGAFIAISCRGGFYWNVV